ncbi:MAG TPA: DUF2141 domain-containing protein [Novosphingobium sp.]|nr:DUF2141 domain-containing protein [Novosphingobium sp.]
MKSLFVAGGAALLAGANAPTQDVSVVVSGLRSSRGQVLACITASSAAFPDCKKDPSARHLAVVVHGSGPLVLDFGPLAPGVYAVSLFHDENANGKLDTMMMIPREGFGFSRDARVRFGPPRFAAAAFQVDAHPVRQAIRMRYMLGKAP